MKYPFLLATILILVLPKSPHAQSPRQTVLVAGKKMSYESFGLTKRRPGEPVLVFEGGFAVSGANSFSNLYPALSKFAAGIGYDRNGDGQSEEDTTLPTDTDLMHRLHEFLAAVHVPPPYILVGHSMGGVYIRLFTALYPSEIAGLLFVDSPNFMLTGQQDSLIRSVSKNGRGATDWITAQNDSLATDTFYTSKTRHRLKRLANLFRSGPYREYASLAPLPDIPVGVLLSYNKKLDSSGETEPARIALAERFRTDNYSAMIKNNHHSFIMLLPGYSHIIQGQDPELVVSSIRRVYEFAH